MLGDPENFLIQKNERVESDGSGLVDAGPPAPLSAGVRWSDAGLVVVWRTRDRI